MRTILVNRLKFASTLVLVVKSRPRVLVCKESTAAPSRGQCCSVLLSAAGGWREKTLAPSRWGIAAKVRTGVVLSKELQFATPLPNDRASSASTASDLRRIDCLQQQPSLLLRLLLLLLHHNTGASVDRLNWCKMLRPTMCDPKTLLAPKPPSPLTIERIGYYGPLAVDMPISPGSTSTDSRRLPRNRSTTHGSESQYSTHPVLS